MPVKWVVKSKTGMILAWQKFLDDSWAAKWFLVILKSLAGLRRISNDGMTSVAVAEALRGTKWKLSVFTMKNGVWKWIYHGTKMIARGGYRITPTEALVYHSGKEQNMCNGLLCFFSKLQMHLQDKIKGNCCLVFLNVHLFDLPRCHMGSQLAVLRNSSEIANYLKYRNRRKLSKSFQFLQTVLNLFQYDQISAVIVASECLNWRFREDEISSIFT